MIRGTLVALATLTSLLVAPPATAAERGPTVVVGDSIVAGDGLEQVRVESYPAQLGQRAGIRVLSVKHRAGCLVAAGCLYGPTMLDTYAAEVLALRPGRVVLSMGVNDLCHVTDRQLRAGFREVLRANRARGIGTVFTTITPQNSRWPWRCEVQRSAINAWLLARFPGRTVDVAAVLESPRGNLRTRFDSGDGLHPNRVGAARMGRAVARWLADRK